jgi:hypothetical protein
MVVRVAGARAQRTECNDYREVQNQQVRRQIEWINECLPSAERAKYGEL